ncbi:MAG: protein-L-isoaspartate O-methyltransferase [Amphiplicatus sp.]
MDYAEARKHMVNSQVRTSDVTDLRLQLALESIPRERFLPAELKDQAYVEREIAYAPGRTLLRARDFAKLAAAADIGPEDLVLDVACGAGYSTAVLAALAETVIAVEADEALAAGAQETLSDIGIDNAAVVAGDPAKGAPSQGPFDVIFIGGAISVEPEALLRQLKEGGRLAAIRRTDGVSRAVIYRRAGEGFAARTVFDAATASVLPEFQAPKTFKF